MILLALVLSLLSLALMGTWVATALTWPAFAKVSARAVPTALTVALALNLAVALAAVLPHHGAGCHCLVDEASVVHLCLFHPERAMPFVPFALAALALLAARPALAALRLARAARATRAVVRSCEPAHGEDERVLLTDLPIRNALAVHARGGRIVADRAWWAGLESWERRAVLAHEKAHLRRKDPLVTMLLPLAASFLPPRLAASLLDRWRLWAEQCADAAAAREIGDPEAVAELLVRQHRLPNTPLAAPALANACSLERRVEALLRGTGKADLEPPGVLQPVMAAAGAVLVAWLAAPAIHHAAESVIAWIR